MRLQPIIGRRVEVGLTIAEKRYKHLCCPNLLISRNLLQLFGPIGKRHKLLEQVDFWNYTEKILDGDIELCLYPNGHLFEFFENSIVHSDAVLFLVKGVPWLAEELVIVSHQLVFLVDLLDKVFLLCSKFAVGIVQEQTVLEFIAQFISLVQPMLIVVLLNGIPHVVNLQFGTLKTRDLVHRNGTDKLFTGGYGFWRTAFFFISLNIFVEVVSFLGNENAFVFLGWLQLGEQSTFFEFGPCLYVPGLKHFDALLDHIGMHLVLDRRSSTRLLSSSSLSSWKTLNLTMTCSIRRGSILQWLQFS